MISKRLSRAFTAVSVRSRRTMAPSSTRALPMAWRSALRIVYDSPCCRCGCSTDMCESTTEGASSERSVMKAAKFLERPASRESSAIGSRPISFITSATKAVSLTLPPAEAAATSSAAGSDACRWFWRRDITAVATLICCASAETHRVAMADAPARVSLSLAPVGDARARKATEMNAATNVSSGGFGRQSTHRSPWRTLRKVLRSLGRCWSQFHDSTMRVAAPFLVAAFPPLRAATLFSWPGMTSPACFSASVAIHLRRNTCIESADRAVRTSDVSPGASAAF
mmetsp:Transcript_621/g.1443  ORF Transcript_621/g.1443 Transcript_621/m.1443 type:complete len:283 (+) Transcript_621:419-1267(+)